MTWQVFLAAWLACMLVLLAVSGPLLGPWPERARATLPLLFVSVLILLAGLALFRACG